MNWCDTSRISKDGNIGIMLNVLTAFEIVIFSILKNFLCFDVIHGNVLPHCVPYKLSMIISNTVLYSN